MNKSCIKGLHVAFAIIIIAIACGVATGQQLRCYKCNSGADPYTCGEKFMDISIVKADNCLCCREIKTNSMWYRTCETTTDGCRQTGVCFSDMCNGHEKRIGSTATRHNHQYSYCSQSAVAVAIVIAYRVLDAW